MPLHDAADDGEAEAVAAGAAVAAGVEADEGLEDVVTFLLGDAGAVVVDDQAGDVVVPAEADVNSVPGVAAGVAQQVAQRALEVEAVTAQLRVGQAGVVVQLQGQLSGVGAWLVNTWCSPGNTSIAAGWTSILL